MIPAHVDRPSFSLSSQLGFIPEGPWSALEVVRMPEAGQAITGSGGNPLDTHGYPADHFERRALHRTHRPAAPSTSTSPKDPLHGLREDYANMDTIKGRPCEAAALAETACPRSNGLFRIHSLHLPRRCHLEGGDKHRQLGYALIRLKGSGLRAGLFHQAPDGRDPRPRGVPRITLSFLNSSSAG